MTAGRVELTRGSVYADQWATALSGPDRVAPQSALGVCPGDVVLVVGAHPDDETFGFGASVASLCRAGIEVHALTMSSGGAALDHVDRAVGGLAARRAAEYGHACRALGTRSSTALDLPDGRLADHDAAIRSAVGELVDTTGADHVVTVWWGDPHDDHRAVGSAAACAARAAGCRVNGYPVWAPHWSDPASPPVQSHRMQLMATDADAAAARQLAVQCYPSQTEPLMDDLEPVLPAWFLRWTAEVLVSG